MALSVIGAGFGRTGTSSLRKALGELGLPCYHMSEVAYNPDRRADVNFWRDMVRNPGASRDWDGFFDGYSAALDFPASLFWRQLMTAYPEARVILTHHPRGSDAWYQSALETIYANTRKQAADAGAKGFSADFSAMMEEVVWQHVFGGNFTDRDTAIARYQAHSETVRAEVPADRLLVFSADQGWDPLCDFLGMDTPDVAFPFQNTRAEMTRNLARMERLRAFRSDNPVS